MAHLRKSALIIFHSVGILCTTKFRFVPHKLGVGGILFKILGRENWYLLDYEHCYYITANRVKIRNGGDFGRDSEVKSCSNGV